MSPKVFLSHRLCNMGIPRGGGIFYEENVISHLNNCESFHGKNLSITQVYSRHSVQTRVHTLVSTGSFPCPT